jgi:hypothetical protein
MKQLTFEQFVETYRPRRNHLAHNAQFDGLMFETDGLELAHVRQEAMADPSRVWTYIVEDEVNAIVPGYKLVNRMGYFICDGSFVSEDIEVNLND